MPVILSNVSKPTLETITGNMLGDGSIGYWTLARDGKASGNARYAITMSASSYD